MCHGAEALDEAARHRPQGALRIACCGPRVLPRTLSSRITVDK